MTHLHASFYAQVTDHEFIKKLLQYTITKGKYSYPFFYKHGFPRGIEPKDVMHEAIKRVGDGDRVWDAEKHPDLLKFMKSAVDSIYSSWCKSNAAKMHVNGISSDDILQIDRASIIEYQSDESDSLLMIRKIMNDLCRGSGRTAAVARGIMEGIKSKDIAEREGIARKDVYNENRKIHRILEKAFDIKKRKVQPV